jgi:hypothetical protein
VGGVRGEPLLLGDLGFELFEHGVERVGEFAELVLGTFHADPVRQRSARGHPCRVPDPREWREHPAGEDPPSQEAEHEQEGKCRGRAGDEGALEVGTAGPDDHRRAPDALPQLIDPGGAGGTGRRVRYVAQQEHPDHGQQESADDDDESGVAEGELQSRAEPWASLHEWAVSMPVSIR